MAIIKAKVKMQTPGIAKYAEYRRQMWDKTNFEDFVYHASHFCRDGVVREMLPHEVVLQPKRNIVLKDIWHCGSTAAARDLIRTIAQFDDIEYLELKGRWVWVQWHHQGKDHALPGQVLDPRQKTFG